MNRSIYACLALVAGAAMPFSATAALPQAVIADPAPDPNAPATMLGVVIPSGDGTMLGTFYMASGSKPHPTVILMHGLPGFEDNKDLAQAISRDGWNALVFNYRGCFGSSGKFSIANAVDDAAAALEFVKNPANAKKYRVDAQRVVIAGHSMGGLLAAHTAAAGGVIGTILIDAWDIAATGRAMKDPEFRQAFLTQELTTDMPPLAGTSPDELAQQVEASGPDLDLAALMQKIAANPMLVIGARGGAKQVPQLIDAARKAGGRAVTGEVMETNHVFSDHRLALAGTIVDWLNALPR
jgi:pimeloyl-ACP methyl ester carboxylesterase